MACVLDNEVSNDFSVSNNVRQGCVLAPALFSVMFSAMLNDAFASKYPPQNRWQTLQHKGSVGHHQRTITLYWCLCHQCNLRKAGTEQHGQSGSDIITLGYMYQHKKTHVVPTVWGSPGRHHTTHQTHSLWSWFSHCSAVGLWIQDHIQPTCT